jgi:hypothetical protein
LPFKCNLQRYTPDVDIMTKKPRKKDEVGLYKLSHKLESALVSTLEPQM